MPSDPHALCLLQSKFINMVIILNLNMISTVNKNPGESPCSLLIAHGTVQTHFGGW